MVKKKKKRSRISFDEYTFLLHSELLLQLSSSSDFSTFVLCCVSLSSLCLVVFSLPSLLCCGVSPCPLVCLVVCLLPCWNIPKWFMLQAVQYKWQILTVMYPPRNRNQYALWHLARNSMTCFTLLFRFHISHAKAHYIRFVFIIIATIDANLIDAISDLELRLPAAFIARVKKVYP